MIKTLARSIREYKKAAILTPLLVTVEVILECIIPFTIANLVNQMQAGCSMDVIVSYGIQLVVMAILSLVFGVAAGNTCATASTGFARKDVYKRQAKRRRIRGDHPSDGPADPAGSASYLGGRRRTDAGFCVCRRHHPGVFDGV